MELRFTTKEQQKKRQEEEFLKLSGSERLQAFLDLCATYAKLYGVPESNHEGNFVLEKKAKP